MGLFDSKACRLPGCSLLIPRQHRDSRGRLVKIFQDHAFTEFGIDGPWEEDFWSESGRSVCRGLHYQAPPFQHAKLVTCLRGEVFDVMVDLRVASPTFCQHEVNLLAASDVTLLYVPPGVAHGFQALTEGALVYYKATRRHEPAADRGVRWDTCGIAWPFAEPILSMRDAVFPSLQEYRENPDFPG